MVSPTCAAGLWRRASSRLIWFEGFSTVSTTSMWRDETQLALFLVDLGAHFGLRCHSASAPPWRSRLPSPRSRSRGRSTFRARPRRRSAAIRACWRSRGHRSVSFVLDRAALSGRVRSCLDGVDPSGCCRCALARGDSRFVSRSSASRASRSLRFAAPERFRDQLVGEDELGFRHVLDRQQHFGDFAGRGIVARMLRGVALDAEHDRRGSGGGRRPERPSRSSPDGRHGARNRSGAPAGGRFRAKKFPADRRGPPGRRHREPATARARASSQSSIVMRAVRPLGHDLHGAASAPEMRTRTSRKPSPSITGSAMAGDTRAASPGSAIRRGSAASWRQTSGSFESKFWTERSLVLPGQRPGQCRGHSGNKKERVPGGAHSQKPFGSSDRYEVSIRQTARNIAIYRAVVARVTQRMMANASFRFRL